MNRSVVVVGKCAPERLGMAAFDYRYILPEVRSLHQVVVESPSSSRQDKMVVGPKYPDLEELMILHSAIERDQELYLKGM